MYNNYLQKKKTSMQGLTTIWKKQMEKKNKFYKVKSDNMASKSACRTAQWIHESVNTNTAKVMDAGCSSLAHPDTSEFRDFREKGSIYLRK